MLMLDNRTFSNLGVGEAFLSTVRVIADTERSSLNQIEAYGYRKFSEEN